MSTIELKAYDIFKTKFKDEEAQTIIDFIEQKTDKSIDNKSLATKQDLSLLELKIEQTKTDIIKWMFAFWIGSTLTTIGSVIAIIKFVVPATQ